jgi:DNA-binding NarL/FixJ family response regulator
MPERVRLFLVEDNVEIRDSLHYLLHAWPGIEVVGAFAAALPALEAVAAGLTADVALVDLGLPDLDGVTLIRRLRTAQPALDVLVLTIFDDKATLFSALRAGATGYLLKDTPPQELADGIFQVVGGGSPMSPSIARQVVADLQRSEYTASPGDNPLTAREGEVLELLAKGATYEQIGKALGVATSTVQAHIRNIYRKLEVCTKAEATAEAYKRRIIE